VGSVSGVASSRTLPVAGTGNEPGSAGWGASVTGRTCQPAELSMAMRQVASDMVQMANIRAAGSKWQYRELEGGWRVAEQQMADGSK
jgi:hypothetical protein